MKLSRDDVLKLAKLSRLNLTEEEIEKFRSEMSNILDYVEMLDKVDVSGLEPTYQVSGLTSQDDNATRADEIQEQVNRQDLMANVPDQDKGQIKVKRMIT